MRTALYTRVSTDMQAEEGFSLDAQLSRLRAYCESQGWSIAGVYTDEGKSAKNIDRPALQRLINDIENGALDVVLVYRLDRLTRSVVNLHELIQFFEKHSVGFRSATEVFDTTSATGRLFITMVAAMAQWERENLGERTRMGLVEATKQGKWSGGKAAFGYNYVNGQLVVNAAEAEIVRELFQRYVSGEGTVSMLKWLNDPETPQLAPNRRWTQWALKYVLRNPLYAGYVRFGYRDIKGHRQANPIINKGLHDAIIDDDIWQRAQGTREARARFPGKSGIGTFSLTGILKCGVCGSPMAGNTKYRTRKVDGPPYRYYICTERLHSRICRLPQIREGLLEDVVLLQLERRYHDLSERLNSLPAKSKKSDAQARQSALDAELVKISARRARWMDAYEEGNITSKELRERLDQLNEREAALGRQKPPVSHEPSIDERYILDMLKAFRANWEGANTDMRKQMIQTVVKRIDVMDADDVRITFVG